MPTIRIVGNRSEVLQRIKDLPAVLAGRIPDAHGVADGLLTAMGVAVLGRVHDSYVTKSTGGTDEMGIRWQPLSPVTLALRTKNSSAKVAARLAKDVPTLSPARRRLFLHHSTALRELYRAETLGSADGLAARRHAMKLLELMRSNISPTRYARLRGELSKEQKPERAERLVLAGAMAEILRDTGRLLNSFSPEVVSPDRRLEVRPGRIAIGSNVEYFKYHQSPEPRKKKADGSDKLPRRQVLPDESHPMPESWKDDMRSSLVASLRDPNFWIHYLS